MAGKERYLKPEEVAEILGIAVQTARSRMLEMPGCINVGSGGRYQSLRVPESGLEAWQDQKILVIPRNDGKIARRPIGRRRA